MGQLLNNRPAELEALWCDPQNGLGPRTHIPDPIDLLLDPSVAPGGMRSIEERFVRSQERVSEVLGEGHPWLSEVDAASNEFGLLCKWGSGFVMEMTYLGPMEEDWIFGLQWNIRRLPHVMLDPAQPWPFPPEPRPGMSDKEWYGLIESYRQEGLLLLQSWRTALRKGPLWQAEYRNLHQHVDWLFQRITPDPKTGNTRTPRMIARRGVDEDDLIESTVKAGMRKAARMLGITISPGVKGPRALRD